MILSKIKISNSLIKKIYQIMLYIIPIAMFSNFFLNTILVIICFIFWYYIISNKDFTWIKNKINLLLIFFSIYIIIQGYFVDNNNSFFKSIVASFVTLYISGSAPSNNTSVGFSIVNVPSAFATQLLKILIGL